MYDLDGKVAIVTGAGGEHGIGRAIANQLALDGADVVVTDIVDDPHRQDPGRWGGAPAVVREIEAKGRRSACVLTDVTDADQIDSMVWKVLERFGCIDILVNNAAARPGSDRVPVVDMEVAAWDEVQRVNLKGVFLCCRAVARHMIDRGEGGKIINVSSIMGRHGRPRFAAYCASKFGLVGLTQSLAQELAAHQINVNAVCPGITDTERVGYQREAMSSDGISAATWHSSEHRQEYMRVRAGNIPLGRVAQPTDIARVTAFLASSQSDYLTGLSINITGGSEMD